jgi:hypothetical protein
VRRFTDRAIRQARIAAPNSPALLYNLGVCAESRGDADAALNLVYVADLTRGNLKEPDAIEFYTGAILLSLGLAIYVVGVALGMEWLLALSLLPVLMGFVLYFLGDASAPRHFFPLYSFFYL